MRHVLAGVVVTTFLLLAGCASGEWHYVHERPPGHATTEVTVRTEPTAADVSVNNEYLGRSPLIVPVRYAVITRVYERRRMLPWPHVETREVPIYAASFRFSAVATGFLPAEESLRPAGEEKLEITIKLHPRPAR